MSVVPSDTAEGDEDLPLVAGEERPEPAEPAAVHVPAVAARRAARRSERRSSRPARQRGERARHRGGIVDAGEHVVEPRAHRALRRRTAPRDRPAVMVSVVTRRSSSTVARSTSPRATSVSTVAETVGLASASWPARSLARSAPLPIMARSRYWARVSGGSSSPHARSSNRARRARVRRSASTPEVYRTVRGPTYVRNSS